MKTFKVTFAREVTEYATVFVKAKDMNAARRKAKAELEEDELDLEWDRDPMWDDGTENERIAGIEPAEEV